MGKRRTAREGTLQILFQREYNDSPLEAAFQQFWENKKAAREVREYSEWLVKGVEAHRDKIDEAIQSVSQHWRLSRMAVVDRNILRMAVFELCFEPTLAPAIVINEALEIAKKYSSDQSALFINGILDAVSKKRKKIEGSILREKKNAA